MSKKLSFSIALNLLLDNFKKGADKVKNSFNAMKERANSFASSSKASMLDYSGAVDKANESSNRLVSTLAKIGGTAALINLGKQIFNVRSDFQNTEAMFKVFLGSTEKAADYMQKMQKYAFNNVFEFKDLTEQAAQLLAYNNTVEDSIPILDKLSNVAAGVNKPLSQFVDLYNKAKSKNKLDSVDIQQWSAMGDVVGYLSEMLGKSTTEIRTMISTGRIGFSEMDQLLTNLTSSGGKFHGMMEEKMKTLGDSYGLLQDSMTSMFNELGEKSEDFLREGVLLGNTLVENYETVGQVLLGLVSTYGVYKVALMASIALEQTRSTLAEKQLTEESMLNVSKLNLAKGSVTYTSAVKAELAVQQQKEIALLQEQASLARRNHVQLEGQLIQAQQAIIDAKANGLSQKKILNLQREAQAIAFKSASARAEMVTSVQAMTAKRAEIATNAASTASVNILTLAKNKATAAAIRLRAAVLANPLALYAAAALVAGYAIYKLATYQTDAEKAQGRLNDSMQEAEKASLAETRELAKLKGQLTAAEKGTDDYNTIKQKIVNGYSKYYKGLADEIEKVGLLDSTYQSLTKSIQDSFAARQYTKFAQAESDNLDEVMSDNLRKIQKRLDKELGDEMGATIYEKVRKSIIDGTSLSSDVVDVLNKAQDKGTIYADSRIDGYIRNIKNAQKVFEESDKKAKKRFGITGEIQVNDDDVVKSNNVIVSLSDQIKNAKNRVSELKKELANLMSGKTQSEDFARDIENKTKELKEAQDKLGFLTTGKAFSSSDNNKIEQTAEKRLEAQRKLTEEERKLQLEKQKFDIQMQQKDIDAMDDSFAKRIKQIKLNFEKEELAIAEHQTNLLDQQSSYLKTKYASIKNPGKSFENWLADSKNKGFKDANGVSVLPEGLRPEDIENQVKRLTDAAQNAQKKGLVDINNDLSTMLRDQELMFASSLERKLAEIDKYYKRELKEAQGNAALIARLEANKAQETFAAKQHDKIDKIDFEEQLQLERVAGMESIGMTELVEEKKLEITKKYLQLKIDALQALADLGDEDAKKQVQMYQASLKKLETQKPITSLKGLADKGIFNVVKKGIESITGSVDEAEEKTIMLFSKFSKEGAAIAETVGMLQSVFGGLDESLDMALETVGNIAQGFATGGLAGGAMAAIGEGMKLFSKASEAAARHQNALKEIADARLASQRAYNLLLREQNLLLEEAVSIFGEKQITRAANAINNYRDTLLDLQKEIKGEKPVFNKPKNPYDTEKSFKEYQKRLQAYENGKGKLADQQIVTGHKKTGMFGWGKGKDTYSSILEVDPQLIDEEGNLNKERLQAIINTRKMSDETKAYLQNLLALEDAAKAAQEELRSYLQTTFGVLGNDIMSSIENAITNKGVNAWEEFGKAGAKVIEDLGKQIAYELFFADKFKKLQEELEGVYGSGKDKDEIASEAMDLVGNFYQNIGKDMELAQGFMENWQKEAEKYGMELWKPDQKSQDSSKGYSVAMDQDTGGKILGRITGIHESIIQVISMVSAINMDTSKTLAQSISISDELKKHTGMFYEMQQIQLKSFKRSGEIQESLGTLADMKKDLESINKNTKGLAPK